MSEEKRLLRLENQVIAISNHLSKIYGLLLETHLPNCNQDECKLCQAIISGESAVRTITPSRH